MQFSPRAAAIQDLVIANRILANEGVLDGFGHCSIRHPERPDRYLMARSRSPELVTAGDIIEFTLDDEPIDQNGRAMYAERAIHGAVYRRRPDVLAICHNHAHGPIPFGVTGTEVRPIIHMASVIGERVPIWDIADYFGDTDLLVTDHAKGDSLATALGDRRAILMRGHGGLVVGATIREVVFTAIYLQVNTKLLAESLRLGEPAYLSPGEVALASTTLLQPLSQERAWDYWCNRAGFRGI